MDKKFIPLVSTVILAATLIFVGFSLKNSNAGQYGTSNTISVEGEGKAYATPDTLTININISELGKDTKEAQELVDVKVLKIKELLSGFNIPKRNIKTTNVNTYTEYDRSNNTRKVLGRRTQQDMSIKVDGTGYYEKGSEIIKKVSEIGGININGTNFSLEDENAASKDAREKAYADAKEKATQLANAAGMKLGKATIINEQRSENYDYPIAFSKEVASMGSSDASMNSITLSPGKTEFKIILNITYKMD